MMYYVKQMPNISMRRIKDVDYEIDKNKGALDYLFNETEDMDGSFVSTSRNFIEEDTKIDKFTINLQKKWGEEESQLRTAIYISFVKQTDTLMFRKKIKRARKSFIRQSFMSEKSKYSLNSRITPKSKTSELKLSHISSTSKPRLNKECESNFGSTLSINH